MKRVLQLTNALTTTAGSEGIKALRNTLFPKAPQEDTLNYENKWKSVPLQNLYARALDNATGYAFKKPIDIQGFNLRAPNGTDLLDDIDGSGNSIDAFGQEAFWNTLNDGVSYIVADYPAVPEGTVRTLADLRALNVRPYLSQIRAAAVCAVYVDNSTGQERLTHFRYSSSYVEPSADFMSEEQGIKVYGYTQPTLGAPVELTVWKRKNGDTQFTNLGSRILSGLTRIPVHAAYSYRTGPYLGRPPLYELAEHTALDYGLYAAYLFGLRIAAQPFLKGTGIEVGEVDDPKTGKTKTVDFQITPYKAAMLPAGADISWVDYKGEALGQVSKERETLLSRMQQMGFVPFSDLDTASNGTATEALLNQALQVANLKAISNTFCDTLGAALAQLGEYTSTRMTVTASLDASFVEEQINTEPRTTTDQP